MKKRCATLQASRCGAFTLPKIEASLPYGLFTAKRELSVSSSQWPIFSIRLIMKSLTFGKRPITTAATSIAKPA